MQQRPEQRKRKDGREHQPAWPGPGPELLVHAVSGHSAITAASMRAPASSSPSRNLREILGRRATTGRRRPAASDNPAISSSTTTADTGQPRGEGSAAD